MNDEEKNSVNVYLTSQENRQRVYGDDKPDPHKHYIIVQNESLTKRSELLTTENNRLQKEFDEKDDEVDKMEITVRYMRGELKNFVELRNLADKISSTLREKEVHMIKQHNITTTFIPKFLTQFATNKSLSMMNWIMLWYLDMFSLPYVFTTEMITILATTMLVGVSPSDINNHKKMFRIYTHEQLQFDDEIRKLQDEIKKTDDGNDFLSKYIDSL
jgi:uncharacterized protein YlxW (UPF0749 family)